MTRAKEITSLEIIKESKSFRTDEYINYFFEKIVGMQKDLVVKYEKYKDTPFYLSIIKDKTSRLTGRVNGRLMEKAWRNCIFYFIDKKKYIDIFGTNSKYYDFEVFSEKFMFNGNQKSSDNSKYPNNPRINWEIIKTIQDSVFELFRKECSSWFVRSYVYITLILCDDISKITANDFQIYYWNTNYVFNKLNSKQGIFNNTTYSYFVNEINEEVNNIEAINKDVIDCAKAYKGNLDFKNDTDENYFDIKKDIDDGIEYILVEGAARTGKTIIAMRLLGEYSDSVFLIMNYYFYLALKDAFKVMNIIFPEKRIYHHSLLAYQKTNGGWIKDLKSLKIIPNLQFLIVDECQRLSDNDDYVKNNPITGASNFIKGVKEISEIINCENHKHTVFFGDNLQRLNPKYDKGINEIYDRIKEKEFRQYNFKKSIGISPEILNNVKYLLDTENEYHVCPSNRFEINLSETIDCFCNDYANDVYTKKHYVSIGLKEFENESFTSNNTTYLMYPKSLRDSEYPFFLNEEVKDKYILSTYQVISREIESVYLYIPNKVTYCSNIKKICFSMNNLNKNVDFLYYHLYTLMTRATLKLTIFCENGELKKHMQSRIQSIQKINKENSNIIEANIANDLDDDQSIFESIKKYDYDIFIAYHGTNSNCGTYSYAKEICDFLKSKSFSVFLNGYSYLDSDKDFGFNETTNAVQRSKNFLLVFNDDVPRDKNGMLARKNADGKINQLYKELKCFDGLVDLDKRTNRDNLRFYYSGNALKTSNIYNFLNQFYQEGTYGNSNCCICSEKQIEDWLGIN